jgi:hypothetical protein
VIVIGRLGDVEAAHLAARLAARRETRAKPRLLVPLAQEIGVERQDDVGRRDLVARDQRLAEGAASRPRRRRRPPPTSS